MLERYFKRPRKIKSIRSSWIGDAIERYVGWLTDQGYAFGKVPARVAILIRFGEFAKRRGAVRWADLPAHVSRFVKSLLLDRAEKRTTEQSRLQLISEARVSIVQMLRLVVQGEVGGCPKKALEPFRDQAPGFFDYLRKERGLRDASVYLYRHHLARFEAYLGKTNLQDIRTLSPAALSSFIIERSRQLGKTSIRCLCGVLRVFLRYFYREQLIPKDLSCTVESPIAYRLSSIPRSITWVEVGRVLKAVDRRTVTGKRDYAILLLLVTYGLRAHEVAGMTLDDIDWELERLRIPERKAGHSAVYPLSVVVGEALVDYLQHGRPKVSDRHVFFRARAPHSPLRMAAISKRVSHYLEKAGISVPRPGSHTLRHTCVQRLVDAAFSLKVIGDYVGHRAPSSTEIYSKVAVEALREVALGVGEEIL